MNYVPKLPDMELGEMQIAQDILRLAVCIQDVLYACSYEPAIPPDRVQQLHRLYRSLLPLVELYFADDSPLIDDPSRGWPPSDGRFKKAK